MQTVAIKQSRLSLKAQTIYTIFAIIASVALPQIFHVMGALSGLGTSLGETFLPMHLPVILVGLLAGPWAGLVTGAISPALSFLLTGMPTAITLPFMVIELASYGFVAGLTKNARLPSIAKVLAAQIIGRAVRAIAILIAVYAFSSNVSVASIWTSITTGIFGLALQWSLIPLIVFFVNNRTKNE